MSKEEVELPLKVLVMGDFTLRQDDTPLEERSAIQGSAHKTENIVR